MAGLPYIQLYIADYLSDTAHLSTEEHGAYLLLIFNYWQRGMALDNTNNRLTYVTRLSEERWNEVQKTLSEFFIVEGSKWTHTRIESDMKRIDDVLDARSRAGIKSGQVRRNKRSGSVQDLIEQKRTIRKDNTKQDKTRDIYTTAFLEWWSVYPRRDGSKKKASESFAKAITNTTLEVLISTAKQYANDPNRKPEFTKMATTWLNGACWESEALPTKAVETTRHTTQAQQALEIAKRLRENGE
jgi:uncharacterized protein YdaU (DUF1376 family)